METPEVINEGKPQGLTKKDYLKNPEKARYRENEREGEREKQPVSTYSSYRFVNDLLPFLILQNVHTMQVYCESCIHSCDLAVLHTCIVLVSHLNIG